MSNWPHPGSQSSDTTGVLVSAATTHPTNKVAANRPMRIPLFWGRWQYFVWCGVAGIVASFPLTAWWYYANRAELGVGWAELNAFFMFFIIAAAALLVAEVAALVWMLAEQSVLRQLAVWRLHGYTDRHIRAILRRVPGAAYVTPFLFSDRIGRQRLKDDAALYAPWGPSDLPDTGPQLPPDASAIQIPGGPIVATGMSLFVQSNARGDAAEICMINGQSQLMLVVAAEPYGQIPGTIIEVEGHVVRTADWLGRPMAQIDASRVTPIDWPF